ncbi:hypothetical protein, partial [Pseudomonas sp. MPR-R2A5]|uniref:hypothetical protein n=1 Tax=Pseudomonas sp. MPR-R2A5 TaxID=2070622 RepID=UPI001C458136
MTAKIEACPFRRVWLCSFDRVRLDRARCARPGKGQANDCACETYPLHFRVPALFKTAIEAAVDG